MYDLLKRLFPICRSLTGEGVRESLRIIQEYIPLEIKEVASGTKVFDWEVPNEWNITDAYIKDSSGNKVVDFKKSNLHVMGYSIPFEGNLSLDELKKHLYSLPEQPDVIPYITSYYKERWGFCLSQNVYDSLKDVEYYVEIDSTLEPGSLTYGELLIPGKSKKEILLSTYLCHPSMANNELSGPVVTTFIASHLLQQDNYYSYRILFIPETIGSITYLSKHLQELKKNVIGGYVLTCCGDEGEFSYLTTRNEHAVVDRLTDHILNWSCDSYNTYSYLERGSDESQYNSPGVDLNIGSLMRSKYAEYPEYHTSADNLEFVTEKGLYGTLEMYKRCLKVFEYNHKYQRTTLCDPKLDKHGLYPTLSTKDTINQVKNMMNLLAYCDGRHDLIWIADKINVSAEKLIPIVDQLQEKNIIGFWDE